MAVAILAAVVVLVVVGLVVAVWAAARARRKFPLAYKPAPWSDVELEGLGTEVNDARGHDPIAALGRADSASTGGRSEPAPAAYAARPVAGATGGLPVVVLVAGAGFLGTGTTAALPAGGKPETKADLPCETDVRRLRLA